MIAQQINIDAVIKAHPGWSVEKLAARYAQTANECENKHYLGVALPKDGRQLVAACSDGQTGCGSVAGTLAW